MIKVKFYKNGLVVSGHADYAEHGKDIVCAGVSSIVQGALNWFVDSKAVIVVESGYVKLVIDSNNQKQIEYLDLLKIQLSALNHDAYNEYISFKEMNSLLTTER